MTKTRPLNRKFKCQNQGCGGKTDCPAWNGSKLYCQKCTVYKKTHGQLPSKNTIEDLKSIGRWRK